MRECAFCVCVACKVCVVVVVDSIFENVCMYLLLPQPLCIALNHAQHTHTPTQARPCVWN